MRAIVVTRPGGPGVLSLSEVPDPRCTPDELLVRVHATALNRADLLQRRGRYPAPVGAVADILGLEFSGRVIDCGSRVRGFRRGERVMGLLEGGGYAETVAVHERLCLRIPPAMTFEEAAALPETFLTAYDALVLRGAICAGETVLLSAAGSGVGTAAAQLARLAGARTIGLCRTASKRRALRELGIDAVIDSAADDLISRVLEASGGEGVDLVLDLVGAPNSKLYLEVLRPGGRLLLIGLLGGSRGEIDLERMLRRGLTLSGNVLRTRPIEEKIRLVQTFARRMLPRIACGELKPVIDRSFPLEQASQAHEWMEHNQNLGKIVLRIHDDSI